MRPVHCLQVDPDALKLAEEIEASRKEIEKLQERVRQLVARRGKRAELVKTTHTLGIPELPAKSESVTPSGARAAHNEELGSELTLEEGMAALRTTTISQVRLIAFKHGAVVFLLENEKTLTVRMDERGPKPLLDLLSANEHNTATAAPTGKALDGQARP